MFQCIDIQINNDTALGDCRKRISRITEDFWASSRRGNGSIAQLCKHFRNKEDGQKDPEDGIFFDRNRLNGYEKNSSLFS